MAEIECFQCNGNGGRMVERCCDNPLYVDKGDCCAVGISEFEPCDICGGSGVIETLPAMPADPKEG